MVDVWAAGVVLFELIEGKTPFKEESHFDIIDRITEIKY
jgi:serine/threonine protein kinase